MEEATSLPRRKKFDFKFGTSLKKWDRVCSLVEKNGNTGWEKASGQAFSVRTCLESCKCFGIIIVMKHVLRTGRSLKTDLGS